MRINAGLKSTALTFTAYSTTSSSPLLEAVPVTPVSPVSPVVLVYNTGMIMAS